jgi:hypothetical protein
MVQPANKTAHRQLVWAGILLAFLLIATLAVWTARTHRARAKMDAAQLVRGIRESENWIHDVNSLLIREDPGRYCRPPSGIENARSEPETRP